MRLPHVLLLTGDAQQRLAELPANSVHCCVTSPPYFGLREYGTAHWEGGSDQCDHVVGEIRTGKGLAKLGERYRGGGHKQANASTILAKAECPKCGAVRIDAQIGLEESPNAYVGRLVTLFREVRRVLRRDGTVWLVLGDSYASSSRDTKPKDLMLIPHRVAFALQTDGWYLRSDVIWAKPNPMPSSVLDRPTTSHEHVFLLTKNARYFYDAASVAETASTDIPSVPWRDRLYDQSFLAKKQENGIKGRPSGVAGYVSKGRRNLRSVWEISAQPYTGAHFATYPSRLAARCIAAGTSEFGCCDGCGAPFRRIVETGEPDAAWQAACGADTSGSYAGQAVKDYAAAGAQNASDVKRRILNGMRKRVTVGWQPTCKCTSPTAVPAVVLDPFSGAGTTLLAAARLGRDSIGVDLNATYHDLTEVRLADRKARCKDTHGSELPFVESFVLRL